MMIDLNIARQTRQSIADQLQALDREAGEAHLNRHQQGKWNKLTRELRDLDDTIAEAEQEQARQAKVAESRAKWGYEIGGTSGSDPWAVNVRTESPAGLTARAHDVLDRSGDLSHCGRESLAAAIDGRNGSAAAALIVARSNPAYESGYLKWLGNPERAHSTFTPAEAEAFAAVEMARATLTTDTGTGGYTVPLSLDPNLAAIVNNGTANPFRAHSTVRTAVSSPHRLVTSAGATAAWTDEGAAFGDGTPAFDRVDVDLFKETIFVAGTYEVLEDGGRTIREALPMLLADARDRLENEAFSVGSGSGAPTGIITKLAATAGSTVTATTRGSFTSASAGDVMAMLAALPPRARQSKSAAWLAPVGIINTIRTMTLGTTGSMVTDLVESGIPQLLGMPVYEASGMSAATTSGSRPLAVVDLSAYSIVDHIAGPTLQYQPVLFDTSTGRANGTAAWIFHHRVGAQLVDPSQGRLLLA